jgi:hypothetical protein
MPARRSEKDDELLRLITDWYFLTADELARLTTRNIVAIRARLQTLGTGTRKFEGRVLDGLNYLYSMDTPAEKFGPKIHYPAQKAFDLAYEEGWISERVNVEQRTPKNMTHDRLVILHRFALLDAFGDLLRWTQHYYNLYHRWGEGPEDHIFADAMYYLNKRPSYPTFFLELENTKQAKYDARGLSARIRKAEGYMTYYERGFFQEKFHTQDFRVIFAVSTWRKAENLAKTLRETPGIDPMKFWITDFAGLRAGAEKVYITPRNYEHVRYSLNDA